MPYVEFNCLPTIIGSMPQTSPQKAGALVSRYLKDIPAWPQLPRRSFAENMYAQFSEGFPGITIEGDRIYVKHTADLTGELEALYTAYLGDDVDKFPIGKEYAAGLHDFLARTNLNPKMVKGQITGPLTWGLTVADENKRAILHDEVLGDAVPKLLRLKAGWQEKQLSRISKNTITFLDEPYMSAYGSSASAGAFASPDKVVALLEEVLGGISGLKGIHCCGNTDWSVLLRTSLDILSFDAYNFAVSLSLYTDGVKKFLDRGGAVAWGIVPNDTEHLTGETAASLQDRLEEAMAPFTRKGVPFKQLVTQGLLTPSCGLATLTEDAAELALALLADLSAKIRRRYT
ncbi:MAG: methionine synthase [Dehalococcoidales bacterium]|nr:methionine synthase [Dehalococcoidales bacterium]